MTAILPAPLTIRHARAIEVLRHTLGVIDNEVTEQLCWGADEDQVQPLADVSDDIREYLREEGEPV